MKRHIKTIAASVLLVAALALALTGATVVQAAAVNTQIAVQNQNVDTGIVVVDAVTAAQPGWVVIYKNPNLYDSEIVGHAWVHQGVNMGVKVVVNMSAISSPPTLWAAFLADNNPPSVSQQWGNNGQNVPGSAAQSQPTGLIAFATTAGPAAAATSAKAMTDRITGRDQDVTSGLVLVDAVTADQNGWVVLYRSPAFGAGDIVGFAPVYRGTNTDVLVKIDASKLTDRSNVWAQLHTDAGAQNVFEWGNMERQTDGELLQVFNDPPVIQNNTYIRASFATTPSPAAPSTGSTAAKSITSPKSTNAISVSSQSLSTGVVVINSVSVVQNGWVVISRSPSFSSSSIVGYAPIYQGTNSGVRVTIDTTRLADQQPMLWAGLLVDQGMSDTFFATGNRGRILSALVDLPMVPNVMAGFGTSGP